jgi:MoxR-like ATPase
VSLGSRIALLVTSEVSKVVLGRELEVKLLLATLISQGHALIEGPPGLAKTTLAKAFAKALSLKFSRIQFTPDMFPSDVTGTLVYNPKTGELEPRPGPIFASIILVDEINRAPPRTQAALLEAMQERQVTIGSMTYPLPQPFMVIATQDPLEMEGTYPLPEAELDRFMIKIEMEYPTREVETKLIDSDYSDVGVVRSIVSIEDIEMLQSQVKRMTISDEVRDYIVEIGEATRRNPAIRLGASPRAIQMLAKLSRAWALLNDEDAVSIDDVKLLAPLVLSHRVFTIRGNPKDLIRKIIEETETPFSRRLK